MYSLTLWSTAATTRSPVDVLTGVWRIHLQK